jgi:hypothetical protein
MLHPADLATNKVMAAAGRREVRDLVDVVTIHETILPGEPWYGLRSRKLRASRQRD